MTLYVKYDDHLTKELDRCPRAAHARPVFVNKSQLVVPKIIDAHALFLVIACLPLTTPKKSELVFVKLYGRFRPKEKFTITRPFRICTRLELP